MVFYSTIGQPTCMLVAVFVFSSYIRFGPPILTRHLHAHVYARVVQCTNATMTMEGISIHDVSMNLSSQATALCVG